MEDTEKFLLAPKCGSRFTEAEGASPLVNGLRSGRPAAASLAIGGSSSRGVPRPTIAVAGFPYGEGVPEEKTAFLPSRRDSYSQRSEPDESMLGVRVETVSSRQTWSSQAEFLLACIGSTVGLGNVWRFPYLCYRSGGGAFLVPYLIMLFVCGIPLLFLELAVGQYTRMGPVGALEKICPLFKGAGLATVVVSFLLCTYYNVILAWTLFYLFNLVRGDLLRGEIPWTKCGNKWNSPRCWDKYENHSGQMQPNDSKTPVQEYYEHKVLDMTDGIERPGDMRWELVIALAVAWLLIYFSIWKSVKSSGKVVYFTATFPYILLIAFLARGLLLEGADQGLLHFLRPRWDQLMNPKVWVSAAAQNFNSIGIAFGTLIAYASYNKFSNNILRDTFTIGLMGALTSILASLVIFATIGHIAHKQNRDIDSVIAEGSTQEFACKYDSATRIIDKDAMQITLLFLSIGPDLIFVIYPDALMQMPWPQIWVVLFFCLLLFLGLDSQFAAVEVVVTSLQDAFPKGIRRCCRRHEVLVFFVCAFCFGCGLPNVTQGGIYFFQLIDYYSAAISLMYLAFFEVIAIVWFYGAGRLARNVQEMTGKLPCLYFRFCWWVVSPLVILAVWVFSLIDYKPLTYNGNNRYPDWAEGLGWGIAFISIVCIPAVAINTLCKATGNSLWEKLRNTIQSPLRDDVSENPGTSSYSLRMSGSRSSATVPPEDGAQCKPVPIHETVKVEQIVSTV